MGPRVAPDGILQIAQRAQFHEVPVSGPVLGQQDQVTVVFAIGVGDPELAADDGFDAFANAAVDKRGDTGEGPVVGEGEPLHPEALGAEDEVADR